MKKRILSCILAFALALSLAPTAFAAADEATEAAQALYELGLFQGVGKDASGKPNFDLNRTPSRNEAVTMLVRLLGKAEEAKGTTWSTPFTDVADWAKPFVGYAYTKGLTAGTSATTYSGNDTVTASQYLTFVLRALGYTNGTDFQWDNAWELSDKIGLTDGRYSASTTNFTRGDAAIISKQALSIKLKDSSMTLAEALPASAPAETKTTSTNDTKIAILEANKSGIQSLQAGLSLCLNSLNYLSDSNESYAYQIAYLVKTFQYDQEYIRKAIGNWNTAITLCGDYSDTQLMKQYLQQLVSRFSQALSYTITPNNVLEYMKFRTALTTDDIEAKIENVMDSWVIDAIN